MRGKNISATEREEARRAFEAAKEIYRRIAAEAQTPTSASELGAKGVGESGTGAAPAVVMNAVNDAIRPFGARVAAQPITPESVLIALGRI